MCHIDLSNCFWSPRLPQAFLGAFRISDGEGGVLLFRCLPFGWKYSPIPCQKVLERLVDQVGLVGSLVLIYIDDVLIVGRGKGRVRGQAMRAVQALRAAGGVISPKSTLEPVTRLVSLGKDVDLGGGSLRTAGNAWEALLAHWLRLSVGVCSVRRLQQLLVRAQWICRPRFGHSPHLLGVWADVLCPPPPRLQLTPVKLLCSMCVVCVLGLPGWSPIPLPRDVRRKPVFVQGLSPIRTRKSTKKYEKVRIRGEPGITNGYENVRKCKNSGNDGYDDFADLNCRLTGVLRGFNWGSQCPPVSWFLGFWDT